MRQRHVEFLEECYNVHIVIVLCTNGHALAKFIKRRFGIKDKFDDNWHALTYGLLSKGKSYQVMALKRWSGDPYSISCLAHESLHITWRILRESGIKLNDKTQEAYCYLHDSIMRRSLELLNKRK